MGRATLLRWVGWFFFVNILISLLIQISYVSLMPDLMGVYGATLTKVVLAYFFLAVSYVAHATIVNIVVAAGVALIACLIPSRWVVFPIATLCSLVILIAQVIDRVAYRLYHAHQFAVGITILKSGVVNEEMPLSVVEYTFLVLIIALIIFIQGLLVWYVWRRVKQRISCKKTGYWVALCLASCVVVSYSMMAFVISVPPAARFDDVTSHLLLKMARLVPYYQTVYDWVIPGDLDATRRWTLGSHSVVLPTEQMNEPLRYPLHPLYCALPHSMPNILFIVFDTLRYDALTPRVMPHVSQFASKTIQFDDAYSGGNCTQPGIFSMFYGIPANYWLSTITQAKSPVLMQALQKSGYQMGIFASASLLFPQFDKNVFVDLYPKPADTPGNTSVARDEKITELFSQFVRRRNTSKPFFGFIFYDAVHNYCEGSAHEHMNPFHPAIADCQRFALTADTDATPYINRYHNAAYFLDQQAAKLFTVLNQQGLLKNTIIIITADHGEQQNDQHMDYWSHASAYTPYQLHIPFLVYWPGMQPAHRTYFVSNFDIVPTLLKNVFHCSNPLSDYTVGQSLFDAGNRPFIIAGSYTDYAYVTQQNITRIYPGGDYSIEARLGQPTYRVPLDIPLLKQATPQLSRYYQQ